jgi:hypothetical protein
MRRVQSCGCIDQLLSWHLKPRRSARETVSEAPCAALQDAGASTPARRHRPHSGLHFRRARRHFFPGMVPSLPPHAAVSTHPQVGVSGGIILLFAKAPHQPRNPVESAELQSDPSARHERPEHLHALYENWVRWPFREPELVHRSYRKHGPCLFVEQLRHCKQNRHEKSPLGQ